MIDEEKKLADGRPIVRSPFVLEIEKALKEPTLLDALTHIAIWESERAIEQAEANKNKPERDYWGTHSGGRWDTCFRFFFKAILDKAPQVYGLHSQGEVMQTDKQTEAKP